MAINSDRCAADDTSDRRLVACQCYSAGRLWNTLIFKEQIHASVCSNLKLFWRDCSKLTFGMAHDKTRHTPPGPKSIPMADITPLTVTRDLDFGITKRASYF
jgi:hypothetical protein